MNPLELARPEIRALQAYSSARMEAQGGAVWLNANESPWSACGDDRNWNRYPDPQPAQLINRLADLYGVAPEQVLVGRGSDEGIDLLVRAFCAAGRDAVLISPPCFGMYAVCARVQGASVVEAPLREDFTLDVDALLAAMTPAVKLVFVCAPNNPAGAGVPRGAIEKLVRALAGRALVVVDEAYIEFAGNEQGYGSVANLLAGYPNLVVLRTLSKAWALAGVRIGALLADARVVALLRKVMPPYPLPSPCVEIACHALSERGVELMQERVREIRAERMRMQAELSWCAAVKEALPSQANFITVRCFDADAAFRSMLDAGIVVRDVRRYRMLADALRITIGTRGENDRVLDALSGVAATNCESSGAAARAGQPA
ncbi:MAG TPA: histidinol-phosphate transaminase [Rhodanobacteraceae bacterium]